MRSLLSALVAAGLLACIDDGFVGENRPHGEGGSGGVANAPEPTAGTETGSAGSAAGAGGTQPTVPMDAGAVTDAARPLDAASMRDAASVDAGGCAPACGAGQICDPGAGVCFECAEALDCEVPDECDDCVPSDLACVLRYCRACTTDGDCPAAEPRCIDSLCRDG